MTNSTQTALQKMFTQSRIVFWYDEGAELYDDFQSIDLEDVNKLELNNNEFSLKFQILRESPKDYFLIYSKDARPEDKDNWLLDVLLAHKQFRTDTTSKILAEVGLIEEHRDIAQSHVGFFKSSKRSIALKERLRVSLTSSEIKLEMMAISCGAQIEAKWEQILLELLHEFAQDKDDRWKAFVNSGLDSVFFQLLYQVIGYQVSSPSLKDLSIELFNSCFQQEVGDESLLNQQALRFLRTWRDHTRYNESFTILSHRIEDTLKITDSIKQYKLNQLQSVDFYPCIEKYVMTSLTQGLTEREMSHSQVKEVLNYRKQSHWFKEYEDFYLAIDYANEFFWQLNQINLQMSHLEDGFNKYTSSWYKVDQLYRKFIYHVTQTQQSFFNHLAQQVNNLYTNQFLLPLGDSWQNYLNEQNSWYIPGLAHQNEFYKYNVKPLRNEGRKVAVIISDAMRYEVAEELTQIIRQQNRMDAKIKAHQSPLPSYTQLGMASLLPHKELSLNLKETARGTVLADGQSTSGIENREKLLKQNGEPDAVAIRYKDFISMTSKELRDVNPPVVYVYHDLIDQVGDKQASEERTCNAAEETLEELTNVVRKLFNANYSQILVTADHGFIYQHEALDESDYVGTDSKDENASYINRRFIIGENLSIKNSAQKWTSEQLGLSGDAEVLIPNSINRFRRQGSGSRFVHGGATLQEIVVPIVHVTKSRIDDVSIVEVDILQGASSIISSKQLSVSLFQSDPVKGKIQPRDVLLGLYASNGTLLSNEEHLTFDSPSEHYQDRGRSVQLLLNQEANAYSNQEVTVQLKSIEPGTSQSVNYVNRKYTLRLNAGYGAELDF